MMRTLGTGLVVTVAVTALLRWGFGVTATVPGLAFGLLATGIQMAAGGAMRGAMGLSQAEFLKRYGFGMALRLSGVLILVVAIVVRRDLFPPMPTALGFLGVLIPLLFLEARLAR